MKIKDIARPYPARNRRKHGCISGELALSEAYTALDTDVQDDEYYAIENDQHKRIGWIPCTTMLHLAQKSHAINLLPILESLKEGIVFIDTEGVILYANNTYASLLGIPLWRVVGRNIDRIEPDSVLRQVLQSRIPYQRKKHWVKSLEKRADISVFPLWQAGELVGAYSVFQDVTQLDFLQKEVTRTEAVAEEYRQALVQQTAFQNSKILSANRTFLHMIHQAETVATTDVPVLVRGENGTGKELVSKFVQMCNNRKDKPFLTVNCAAIPESLLESELFGYEEGTFTGGKKGGKLGKFQIANGGTLFLDEIGDMPLAMQAKLLRALQEGEIEKLGSSKVTKVDVRIIAATNQPLEKLIEENKFRQDLFYRINVFPLTVPPLREREEDIILLAQHFLERESKQQNKQLHLTQEVAAQLTRYAWPGNVRELQNTISYISIASQGPAITLQDLPESIFRHVPEPPSAAPVPVATPQDNTEAEGTLKEQLARYECAILERALQQTANKSEAIKKLGISRKSFYEKLYRYGLYEKET